MDNIHILCISDIHFNKCSAENQGLVVREFFKDLPKVLNQIDRANRYCIIAGDLVQAGNMDKSYDDFYDIFLSKLTKYIDLDHIICTPGNHDLNRNILIDKKWKKKHIELLNSTADEESFNEILKNEEDSIIRKKFACFDKFCTSKLSIPSYDLFGYSVNLVPEISVYCLNSALLSNGGQKGFVADEGILKVDTSGLYKWAHENEGRTKILVMHHPLNHLSEYVRDEIENILRKDVDVLITGHLHRQSFRKYIGVKSEICKFCSSPQLFSDKKDPNGYSILHFEGKDVTSIEYRKWSTFDEEFTFGTEFSRTSNGVIEFAKQLYTEDDVISRELENKLRESLNIYNYTPSWVNRILSNYPPQNRTNEGEIVWDHINIVNSSENIQIIGGSQFGLTSLCNKVILEAWRQKKEHWIFLEGKDLRLSKVQTAIELFANGRGIKVSDVATVVVDNWNRALDKQEKLLSKICQLLPDARIILVNNEEDSSFFCGLSEDKNEDDFQVMYLRELERNAIRKLTLEYIKERRFNIEENDKILERLILELLDLNVHRTPVNCIQLLMNFQQNYESRPINRSKILSSLLQFFFLKPDSFYYTDSIDEEDCCIIMGALCKTLLKNNDGDCYQRLFSEDEYIKATDNIPQRGYTVEVRQKLLKSMIEAQIIVPYLNLYEFRFSYWVYYFAAYQMYSDKSFYDYMVNEQKCIHMPEIIEFYTGIDPKCADLIESIISELNTLSSSVSSSLGVCIANPYKTLKCRPNPALETKTREQLEEDIMASRLPEEIKDSVADKNYEVRKPYFQAIETVMDKFNVRNMMNLARSASRALRNSSLIDEDKRYDLYKAVENAWYSLFEVLVLLTPALARNGRGAMGGASFQLTDDFDKDEELSRKLIHIVAAIPFNIVNWYKNDVFSEKRMEVFTRALNSRETGDIKRHINILLVISSRPKGWKNIVQNYIKNLSRNSFYLGDVKDMLNTCFALDTMSKADQNTTKKLIIECLDRQKGNTISSLTNSPIYIPKR